MAATAAIGRKIGPLLLGKLGTMDRASLIVRGARLAYMSSVTWIVGVGYAGWRNQRLQPGDNRFPFPGVDKMKAKYSVDRPNTEDDPGYQPQGVGRFGDFKAPAGPAGPIGVGEASGSWGGTKKIADLLTDGIGLQVTSTKRSTQSTSSGGVSDHWQGCKECYAKDMSGTVGAMDRAARMIMSRLNAQYSGGAIVHTTVKSGFRIQVLYKTMVGGNHFDHIHVGIRKVGYAP